VRVDGETLGAPQRVLDDGVLLHGVDQPHGDLGRRHDLALRCPHLVRAAVGDRLRLLLGVSALVRAGLAAGDDGDVELAGCLKPRLVLIPQEVLAA